MATVGCKVSGEGECMHRGLLEKAPLISPTPEWLCTYAEMSFQDMPVARLEHVSYIPAANYGHYLFLLRSECHKIKWEGSAHYFASHIGCSIFVKVSRFLSLLQQS